jgi:hypothetical protein
MPRFVFCLFEGGVTRSRTGMSWNGEEGWEREREREREKKGRGVK